MKANFLVALVLLVGTLYHPSALCQSKQAIDLSQGFSKNQLIAHNRKASLLSDPVKKGVVLDENKGEGLVWLKDVTFSAGTIEVDLKGQDVLQRSFLGIAFHGADNETYDAIYFRPFNFQTTDSVRRIHAVQYISHPVHTWKKLREEQNGQYEKAVQPVPDPNDWFHARIEVTATTVTVYVNGATVPSLTVNKLNDRKRGTLGLWVGDSSGGSFANLTIRASK